MGHNDAIDNVKAKIQDKEGIPKAAQRLICHDRLLEDDDLLSYNYIQEKSTLHLVTDVHGGVQIFVKTIAGKRIALQVQLAINTIGDVKDKIQDKVGIPRTEQRINFAGRPMDDGFVLSHYNIQEESTLNLALPGEGGALLAETCGAVHLDGVRHNLAGTNMWRSALGWCWTQPCCNCLVG